MTPDDDTGSVFPVPDESELPERIQGLFGKAREALGFVPNVFRVWSYRPERLSAWFGHFRLLHEPTEGLTAADREMVAVVVSQANGCLYCLVAHGQALREALGDPIQGDRITLDWRRAGLDDRRRAICAFAEKLTLRPREVEPEDVQSLRDAGPHRGGGLGRRGDRVDVQPHEPHGDGDRDAPEPRVPRDVALRRFAAAGPRPSGSIGFMPWQVRPLPRRSTSRRCSGSRRPSSP